MTVTSGSAFCRAQYLHGFPIYLFVTGNDHLGNAFAVLNGKRLVAEIDQTDAYLSTIVGIDGSGSIQHGDAVFKRQSATGSHLRFITYGQLDKKSRRNKPPFQGLKGNGF